MAFYPVSGSPTQYSNENNELASDYWLKFYIANTTTAISMYTDDTGATSLAKCKLNADGFPITNPLDNDTVFIPYVDQKYRYVIFKSETDADNDATSNAFVNVAAVNPITGLNNIGTASEKDVTTSDTDITSDRVLRTENKWHTAQTGDYFTYGGTADAITLTSVNTTAVTSLVTGQRARFRATAANTGAATINVDGLGATACITVTGVALPADYIRTDVDTEATYDGTNWVVSRKVESGSNANGEFTRWEDGTMLQKGEFSDSITSAAAITANITLPASMVSTTNASASTTLTDTVGGGEFLNYQADFASVSQLDSMFIEFSSTARTGAYTVRFSVDCKWY